MIGWIIIVISNVSSLYHKEGKMLEYIRTLPVINCNIDKKDFDKIIFPFFIDELLNVTLQNDITGKSLTPKDHELIAASNKKTDKNDKIFITVTMKEFPNIKVELEISKIFQYSCDIKRIMEARYIQGRDARGFWGARLDILDNSYYMDDTYPYKVIVHLRDDIIFVEADEVVIKEVSYV